MTNVGKFLCISLLLCLAGVLVWVYYTYIVMLCVFLCYSVVMLLLGGLVRFSIILCVRFMIQHQSFGIVWFSKLYFARKRVFGHVQFKTGRTFSLRKSHDSSMSETNQNHWYMSNVFKCIKVHRSYIIKVYIYTITNIIISIPTDEKIHTLEGNILPKQLIKNLTWFMHE